MTLETNMDGARRAMGNSTTAWQLIETGLAGGALEGYLSGWDPTHVGAAFLSGPGARAEAAEFPELSLPQPPPSRTSLCHPTSP